MNKAQEAQIGRRVVAQLRNAGAIMEDPQVTEYIQTLGAQLAGHANDGDQSFEFFMVDDDAINAFALPGGFIGMNAGLILASETESEVAGVLAHEVAHVTQRHIARSLYDNQRSSIISMASMLAAVLLGMASDSRSNDAMSGVLAAGQAATMQRQINFTRSNELEADRIGIGTLSSAGFDPSGMATFFEKLSRRFGSRSAPAFLLTHPTSPERIADARVRIRQLPPAVNVENSISYETARARLEVLRAPRDDVALNIFRTRVESGSDSVGDLYGLALSLSKAGLDDDAQRYYSDLINAYPGILAFRIGEAESLLQNRQTTAALQRYADAMEISPRNVPLTTSYAEALILSGRPDIAHNILLDLLHNTSSPTAGQFRLVARAANAEGDVGNAHHYMSHYYTSIGSFSDALNQIQMAIESPGVDAVDFARFQSEFADLNANMSSERRNRRSESVPREEPPRFSYP
jgi:predicted Zn-dependent protease